LKGKPVNVRDAKFSVISKNEEIKNLISILGLDVEKKYTGIKDKQTNKHINGNQKKTNINEMEIRKKQTKQTINKQTQTNKTK